MSSNVDSFRPVNDHQSAFSALVGDFQFSALGLVLLGLIAKLPVQEGHSPRSGPVLHPETRSPIVGVTVSVEPEKGPTAAQSATLVSDAFANREAPHAQEDSGSHQSEGNFDTNLVPTTQDNFVRITRRPQRKPRTRTKAMDDIFRSLC